MNRLIIVGNGFDLAHGLKTGYCDFINYYLKEVFENLNQRGYSDELIQVSVLTYIPFYNFPDYKTWANLSPIELLRHFQSIPKLINVQFHSPMLERCIDKAETLNWVDIENEFFEELNTCKNLSTGEFITESVNIVNSQFSFLKEKLIEYLIEVENEAENINRNEELFAAFQKRLDTKSRHGSQKLKKLFLNFNYTDTLR
ncbi:MAG: AbiH family protein, partial [Cellulomonas sp.]|nr:AbiH family protein [Cellulomonas sp.]